MENKVIVDGKVQRNPEEKDGKLYFTISVLSGKTKEELKFTRIKTFIELDKISEVVRHTILTCGFIRVYARLDSEIYDDKNGRKVFNKVLNANKVVKIKNENGKILEC